MKLLLTCALATASIASPALEQRQASLNNFVTTERGIALTGALENIGGFNSSFAVGASPGIVVASPSTVNPDYFFTWTRDSALTYAMIIEQLVLGNASLQKTVEDYTTAQARLQTVTNPSGSLYPAGAGLGDPKFYTNETRFNGDWGRPQRDGPALRATALMNLADVLLVRNASVVKTIYWPIILNDLKYVGQYWNNTGYDLWEEVHGSSFFTYSVQHRALVQGALLAQQIGVPCKPCQQAAQILCFIQSNFWNATGKYITADINVNNVNRSGINNDPILAAIHVFDINATCNAGSVQPCNSKMLSTFKVFVDAFRDLYPINHNKTAPKAVLVGRYPEDTYYTGNPWPLCTLACAEMLYDAAAQFKQAGEIIIDRWSLPFWKDLYPKAKQGRYVGDAVTTLTTDLRTYADGFVSAVEMYLPANGSISEQFNKTTGESTSASKLTWSFASFVTMATRRSGQFPPSWGANSTLANTNLTVAQCMSTSWNSTGTYTPARAAGAPAVDKSCRSELIFTCNATTMNGQNIYLVGNTTDLGGSVNNQSVIILPMNPGNYTSARAEWFSDIWLPAGMTFEYQYVQQNQTSSTYVFENVTRTLHSSACGSGLIVYTNDAPFFPNMTST